MNRSHGHHLHFFQNREMNELYLSVAIRSFSISMVGIFIPIYLLQLGYSLVSVFLFFALYSLAHFIFAIPTAHVVSRFGFKHSILFSIPLTILFILGLHTLEHFQWPLWVLALLVGLAGDLYWIGYHIDFSKFSDKEGRSREVGVARVMTLLFHALGPIMGGYILISAGFQTLFIIVSVLLFFSAVPLFFSGDVHEPWELSFKNFLKGQSWKEVVSFMGHGFENGMSVIIWPIFIFYAITTDFSALGFLTSLQLLFSLFVTFLIGGIPGNRERLTLRLGATLNAMAWGMRYLVRTVPQVAVVDAIYGVAQTLVRVPFNALTYDKANDNNIVQYITFRELSIHVGSILLFVVMMLLASMNQSFLVAGAASFLYFLF